MNKIDTSQIVDPNVQQPFEGLSVDFLTNAIQSIDCALAQNAVGDSNSPNSYVLYGCQKVDLGSGHFSFAQGYIFDNTLNEIIYFPGNSNIVIATAPILTLSVTPDPTADPVTFSDGSVKNVHNVRKLIVSDGALNSGNINYVDLIFLNSFQQTPTYAGSYIANPTSPIKFRIKGKKVTIKGASYTASPTSISTNSVIFTLPVGYRPLETQRFACVDPTIPVIGILAVAANGDVGFRGDIIAVSSQNTYINCSFDID